MIREPKTARNEEALADPNYNPELDPKALKLYKLMTPCDTAEDPTLLQQYIDQFMALPTSNIYSQVLVNPRKCDIQVMRDWLSDYDNHVTIIRDALSPTDQATFDSGYGTVTSDETQIGSDLDDFEDHTDRLTANLPTLGGMAQGSAGLSTALNGLANPCGGLAGMLGSLMPAPGGQMLNQAMGLLKGGPSSLMGMAQGFLGQGLGAINPSLAGLATQGANAIRTGLMSHLGLGSSGLSTGSLLNQALSAAGISGGLGGVPGITGGVGGMLSALQNGMSSLKGAVAGLKAMAMNEISAFANSMISQLRMGLADFMASMHVDPCLAGMVSSMAGSAASAILGGL
jgi:hypothetical protein